MTGIHVDELGDFIRSQRHAAGFSLRHLADRAQISNPYLSQIERGLRRPSAEILQRLAAALRLSAETLYVQAGLLTQPAAESGTEAAIAADPHLSERHRQVLLEIYRSLRADKHGANGPETKEQT